MHIMVRVGFMIFTVYLLAFCPLFPKYFDTPPTSERVGVGHLLQGAFSKQNRFGHFESTSQSDVGAFGACDELKSYQEILLIKQR